MSVVFSRFAGALLAALCLAGAVCAQPAATARSLTVDDLLGLEAFGRATLSSNGRWAIYERRGAYDAVPRFEANGRSTWASMELWVVDLANPAGPPERLLPHEGLGLQWVAWSPSADRLLITRLREETFEYGIVDIATRSVRWTGLTPELPLGGATGLWVSDEALILATRPDGSLPLVLGYDRASTRRRAEAWERTAQGRDPSRTVIDARAGVLVSEVTEALQALVHLNPSTGETRTLAEGLIADFAASPDGHTVALVSREETIPLGQPELLHMEDDRRRRLVLIDADTGQVLRRVEGLDIAPHLLRWSFDSQEVLVWARIDGARWDDGEIIGVSSEGVQIFDRADLDVGESSRIVLAGVQADWIGRAPVLYAGVSASPRRDWHLLGREMSPRNLTAGLDVAPATIASAGSAELAVLADGRYSAMTASGLQPRFEDDASLRAAAIFDLGMGRRLRSNEAPRRDWFAALDDRGRLILLGRDGRAAFGRTVLDNEKTLAVAPQAALRLRPVGMTDELILQGPGTERRIDQVNAALSNIVPTEPTPIRHVGIDGEATTSWLFLPRGEGQVRGVIVSPYPGWADNLARLDPLTMTYSSRPEVFLAAGYAVFSPSIPGELGPDSRGEGYTQSVDLAVDAMLTAFPRLPRDRLAVFGHSFGGYAALEIATRSTRYSTFIVSSGYSDLYGVWGEFDAGGRVQPEHGMFFRFNQGWTEVGQGDLRAPPWAAQTAYADASPFFRADHIARPVLFLTADLDFTPMTQAERMFSAILRNNGHARLVTYWGEKHLIWSPANIRDRYEQIFDWLDETIGTPAEISPPTNGPPRAGPSPQRPPP